MRPVLPDRSTRLGRSAGAGEPSLGTAIDGRPATCWGREPEAVGGSDPGRSDARHVGDSRGDLKLVRMGHAEAGPPAPPVKTASHSTELARID